MKPRAAGLTTFLLACSTAALPAQQRGLRAGESDVEIDEAFCNAEPKTLRVDPPAHLGLDGVDITTPPVGVSSPHQRR